jgi:hypothetical protein
MLDSGETKFKNGQAKSRFLQKSHEKSPVGKSLPGFFALRHDGLFQHSFFEQ